MEQNIGFIGCGAVTEKLYLPILPNLKGFKIAYLADKNQPQAQKLAQLSGASVVDIDTLRQKSDIIIICTPPESHYNLVKDSLQSGKIVVCEKPFMTVANQVPELLEIASQKKAKLYVAHFRRTFPNVTLARQLASTSNFGELKSIFISEGGRFNWETVSDYYRSSPLGGVAFDTGSHTIDMALYASGVDEKKVDVVSAKAKKDKAEPSHEVDADLELLVDGKKVNMNVNFSRYKVLANQIVLSYEHGNIVFSTALNNYVKIEKGTNKTIVYAADSITKLSDAFLNQYKLMFYGLNDSIFVADRFYNLTKILEQINKA